MRERIDPASGGDTFGVYERTKNMNIEGNKTTLMRRGLASGRFLTRAGNTITLAEMFSKFNETRSCFDIY